MSTADTNCNGFGFDVWPGGDDTSLQALPGAVPVLTGQQCPRCGAYTVTSDRGRLSCAECLVSLGIADDWYRDHRS